MIEFKPLWELVKEEQPWLAQNIRKEFDRVNGLLPFEHGYVYLMQAVGTGYYKIGKSINPGRRLLEISPKMPFETRLVRTWRSNFMSDAEKMLHSVFDAHWANGEWFLFSTGDLYDLIRGAAQYHSMIRDAYAFSFWERVAPLGDDDRDGLEDWFLKAQERAVDYTRVYPYWVDRDSIPWIDDAFGEIEQERLRLPADIQALMDEEDAERAIAAASFLDGLEDVA